MPMFKLLRCCEGLPTGALIEVEEFHVSYMSGRGFIDQHAPNPSPVQAETQQPQQYTTTTKAKLKGIKK